MKKEKELQMDRNTFLNMFEGTDVRAEGIWEAQKIAGAVLDELPAFLRPGLTQAEIAGWCERRMTQLGAEAWWHRGGPALVLFSGLTAYSGADDPSPLFAGLTVSPFDLVTVDVAPMVRGGWGDKARSYFMTDGKAMTDPYAWGDAELIRGYELEMKMHAGMLDFMDEDTSFADLHAFTRGMLDAAGYVNCDYHGNFGHSIENHPDDRVTIIPDEHRSVWAHGRPFTFEPHVRTLDGSFGLKHENMYCFVNGKLEEI